MDIYVVQNSSWHVPLMYHIRNRLHSAVQHIQCKFDLKRFCKKKPMIEPVCMTKCMLHLTFNNLNSGGGRGGGQDI